MLANNKDTLLFFFNVVSAIFWFVVEVGKKEKR